MGLVLLFLKFNNNNYHNKNNYYHDDGKNNNRPVTSNVINNSLDVANEIFSNVDNKLLLQQFQLHLLQQ